ncbi:MAG: cupin domain-containing protein, partial [Gemmatimonadaceae bacterium]
MSEVLNSVHLVTAVFGRLDLGSPWRLQVPSRPYLSFYVVTRGSGWLDLPNSDNGKKRSISLSTGDAVLIPRGTEHALRDADRS